MKRLISTLVLLAAASVSPLIFPLAESGHSSMDVLAKFALLPSIAVLGIIWGLLHRRDDPLTRNVAVGLAAGAVATVALEALRLPGFWLGFMPGNLPRLMGVLLLNQFATGCWHQTWPAGRITSGTERRSGLSMFSSLELVAAGLE